MASTINSKLLSCQAYDPSLTAEKAVELVQATEMQGAFVIRPSGSAKGDLTITAYWDGKIYHHRIIITPTRIIVPEVSKPGGIPENLKYFTDLNSVTAYYKDNFKLVFKTLTPLNVAETHLNHHQARPLPQPIPTNSHNQPRSIDAQLTPGSSIKTSTNPFKNIKGEQTPANQRKPHIHIIRGDRFADDGNQLVFDNVSDILNFRRREEGVYGIDKIPRNSISSNRHHNEVFEEAHRQFGRLSYGYQETQLLQDYFRQGINKDVEGIQNGELSCERLETLLLSLASKVNKEMDGYYNYLKNLEQVLMRLTEPSEIPCKFLTRTDEWKNRQMTLGDMVCQFEFYKMTEVKAATNINEFNHAESYEFVDISERTDRNSDDEDIDNENYDKLQFSTLERNTNPIQTMSEPDTSHEGQNMFAFNESTLFSDQEPQPNFEANATLLLSKNIRNDVLIKLNLGKETAIISFQDKHQSSNLMEDISTAEIRTVKKDESAKSILINYANHHENWPKIIEFHDKNDLDKFYGILDSLSCDLTPKAKVKIFVGTWNMGGNLSKAPNIRPWLTCQGSTNISSSLQEGYDIYVIGTQESGMSNLTTWTNHVKNLLNQMTAKFYVKLDALGLVQMKIAVFCSLDYHKVITNIKHDFVRTGNIPGVPRFGNKGAVAISFQLHQTHFCFINSHLAARAENLVKRNDEVQRIAQNLRLGNFQSKLQDVTHQFHHIFWFGDLNYRVDANISEVNEKVVNKQFTGLLNKDQLNQQKSDGIIFFDWEEKQIDFAPTYRLVVGSNNRYMCYKNKGSAMDVKSSDHLPVYGLFEADIYHNNIEVWLSIRKSQRPKDWKPKDHLAYIKVISVHVLLKSHQEITESLILEFHSNCLNSPIISGPNKSYWSDNLNVREQQFARFGQKFEDRHQCPEWTIREFSQEEYFKDSDLKYLNGQTLLAILKTSDTKHYKGKRIYNVTIVSFSFHFVKNTNSRQEAKSP
ncbi:Phosphatidylinositol 3,4,5-trisphosphate 5-phosphatase 2 [Trichoplax sp. H2]|nr:Phosphatidylinositol 3,4,5-trisphosphate 5-phosphatase 2 [Trichoplax sp. H2]|eukprot:RDD47574.1 Phosphatidylinositol 3,4,5-trisphosphate 5-phosphatase 2 [Trichoplax sp. H2]